jgi:hypothetical protein
MDRGDVRKSHWRLLGKTLHSTASLSPLPFQYSYVTYVNELKMDWGTRFGYYRTGTEAVRMGGGWK